MYGLRNYKSIKYYYDNVKKYVFIVILCHIIEILRFPENAHIYEYILIQNKIIFEKTLYYMKIITYQNIIKMIYIPVM